MANAVESPRASLFDGILSKMKSPRKQNSTTFKFPPAQDPSCPPAAHSPRKESRFLEGIRMKLGSPRKGKPEEKDMQPESSKATNRSGQPGPSQVSEEEEYTGESPLQQNENIPSIAGKGRNQCKQAASKLRQPLSPRKHNTNSMIEEKPSVKVRDAGTIGRAYAAQRTRDCGVEEPYDENIPAVIVGNTTAGAKKTPKSREGRINNHREDGEQEYLGRLLLHDNTNVLSEANSPTASLWSLSSETHSTGSRPRSLKPTGSPRKTYTLGISKIQPIRSEISILGEAFVKDEMSLCYSSYSYDD
mmetsp:Transcript_16521/g.38101  ORF Transcript_16521/g.38101 Transcript_16521/m.38101 type:complete len:303 (+) Transcript_16521:92-1000(+)